MYLRKPARRSWLVAVFAVAALLGARDARAQSTAFLQSNAAVPQTPQTVVSVPFALPQTAGDLNVVVVGASDPTAQVQSVADTSGNAYLRAVGPTVHPGGYSLSIYFSAGIAAAATNTVTVTFAAPASYPDIRIAEYSGIDRANPLDGTAAAQGTSATSDSGPLTTTRAGDLLVSANQVQTSTASAGSGFSLRVLTAPNGDILEDGIATSPGSYNATALLSQPGDWIMQTVAFRSVGGGSSTFLNEVVVQNLNFVPTMAFLPDGKMLMGEIGGTIRVVQPGASQADPTPFNVVANAVAVGDAGLLSLTLDPAFAQNNYYYVYFARNVGGSSMRDTVSRFTATPGWNGTVAGSEFVVWQDDADTSIGHHGATVGFGPDGKLYISTGEHDVPSNSQSLTTYRGKILRVNSDGSIPGDNPFVDGPGGNKDEIWAYGLRNPYRFSFDPVTGRMYVGDVGGNNPSTAFEEINLVVRGANYGWPLCEGPCAVAGVTSPIYSYPHQGRDAAVMGGFVYRGSQFPAEYQGNYFFADYAQNWLKRLTLDPTGTVVTGVFPFQPLSGALDDPAIGDPVELKQGPDGALYYLDLSFDETGNAFNAGTLRRVRFVGSGANRPPSVSASASPTSGQPPLTVSFSSAGTFDPDGDPLTFSWAFGDGTTSSDANPTHTYLQSGRFAVSLTVSDGVDSSFTTLTIVAGTPPVGVILAPAGGATFRAGQRIFIYGDATDTQDGVLPDSAFTWTIVFHHEGHVHPGLGPVTGVRSLTFDIPVSGHDFTGLTSYEIILAVVDADGLQHVSSVSIFPDKVSLSIDTVPSGLTVQIDGISTTTPSITDPVKGFQETLAAPNQTMGGHQYEFVSWSDGGAQSHLITVPDQNASYIASFREVVPLPGAGLVAAYAFNEGTGTAVGDASGNGLTGTIAGATWTTAGRYGNALSFNGTSSYVNLGNPTGLQLTGSATWSAWVFATTNPPDDGQIIAKSSGAGWQLKTSPDTGPHTFAVGVSASSTSITQRYSTTVRSLNTWYHVAGVYNAAARTLDIYVNGVLDNGQLRGTVPASQYNSPQNVNIGRRSGGFYFPGRIDEVRIYNRALTQGEIQADMIALLH